MRLQKTNIEEVLTNVKQKEVGFDGLPKQLIEIFGAVDDINSGRITQNLSCGKSGHVNHFDFDLLDPNNIYHIDHIKKVCIDYRLRFLDSTFFKGDIPPGAIAKIKELEKQHHTELKGFKIVAPSKLFKLKDKDDPLLFVPMGNDYFYLVHKWGNDLHPLRKIMMWPFKDIVNLAILILVLSYLITLLTPMGLFSRTASRAEFWIVYFFVFKSVAAVVIFYGIALGKNFNPAIWNSKYFNV